MQDFFHAKTTRYTRLYHRASAAVGIFLMLPCLLCFISLIFDFRSLADKDYTVIRLCVIAACVSVWIILSFLFYAITTKKIKRVSRYTYFEIQQNNMIFSRYSGSWSQFGKRTVVRTLYVIPFEGTKILLKDGVLCFKGKIRRYDGDNERLGYHIKRGELKFDNWWYDENGYKELKSCNLPPIFAKTAFMFRCCKAAQNRSAVLAEKKRLARLAPQKPAVIVQKKPRKRIYTEIPTYNRKW